MQSTSFALSRVIPVLGLVLGLTACGGGSSTGFVPVLPPPENKDMVAPIIPPAEPTAQTLPVSEVAATTPRCDP